METGLGKSYARPPEKVTGPSWRYAGYSANIDVVSLALSYLGVSSYRLGFLLGVPTPGNAAKWVNGSARISQPYLCRLARVLLLKASEGLEVRLLERINWELGELHYWGGSSQSIGPSRPAMAPVEDFTGCAVPDASEMFNV